MLSLLGSTIGTTAGVGVLPFVKGAPFALKSEAVVPAQAPEHPHTDGPVNPSHHHRTSQVCEIRQVQAMSTLRWVSLKTFSVHTIVSPKVLRPH